MKNTPTKYMVLILMLLQLSCSQEQASSPLELKAYEHNPILVPGKKGSYDEGGVLMPFAVNHNDTTFLFYSGWSNAKNGGICLATSTDGYHFDKHPGNPIFGPGGNGFDSYAVGTSIVIKDDSTWVMFYNGAERAIYSPGPYIGMAIAKNLAGPWIRMETPVLKTGKKGEWDDGFILPGSVLKMKDGSYRMYFSGGGEFSDYKDFSIGLATSRDGITWVKYNEPDTREHPFAESDPVMKIRTFNHEGNCCWMPCVQETQTGYEMYYTDNVNISYASSPDGIHWDPYAGNPVFTAKDDHYACKTKDEGIREFPSIVYNDSICFLYFDYGTVNVEIGVAIAKIHKMKCPERGIFP
jgi:predicted GH43/DUF377 family glycosyl hydrolase